MTPLIDVVFLLIIFFMLSSSFISNPSIKIDLPKSQASEKTPNQERIEITITKNNDVYIDSLKTSLSLLKDQLKKRDPATPILIRADENVIHKHVIDVMSAAKELKFNKLAFYTKSPKMKH